MNRIAMLGARVATAVAQRPGVAGRLLNPSGARCAQLATQHIRRFAGTAHGHDGKAEPFMDPKIVAERVISVVKNFEKVQAAKVTATARFKEDLDLDSLDAVEVVMAVEEEFGIEIPDSEADKILSIADAVAYVSGHPMAK